MTPEQLKASILQRAMEGKLVPQNPNDEPASELLKRIKAEKEKLISEGKIKRDKKETEIFRGDDGKHYEKFVDGSIQEVKVPYDIPENWEWVKLGSIGTWNSGATPPKSNRSYYSSATIPWLLTGDLTDSYITNIPNKISDLALKETSVKVNPTGSILIAMYGATVGKLGILTFPATTNQACCACSKLFQIEKLYLFYFLMAERNNFKFRAEGGAQPNISKIKIINTFIPLPPLSEQQRIVEAIESALEKVDKYAESYDRLEQLDKEFPDKLKKSILQYAMQGKLVEQDPNDESVEVLLEKIRAEKQKLFEEGKIKKKDLEISIVSQGDDNSYYEEVPYEIPKSWEWVRFSTLVEIVRGGSPRPIKDYLTSEVDGINWIKIGDTEKGEKYINNVKEKIKKSGLNKTRFVKKGTFLLTNSMSFGRPYILNVDGAIHDGWLAISNYENSLNRDYLFYILSSNVVYSQFLSLISGAVVKNLNSDKVASILIPLPPLPEQSRIVDKIEKSFAIIDALI